MLKPEEVLTSDPETLGGEKVFAGTRVRVRNLLDYLAGGHTLSEFSEEFPSVSAEQARPALNRAREALAIGAGPY